MNTKLCYYGDSTFCQEHNDRWQKLVNIAVSNCDSIEFNILKKDYSNVKEISDLSDSFIEIQKRKEKIYPSGYCIKYKLSEKVIAFVKSKNYADWKNYYLEDLSFIRDNLEILSTITHENYVIMLMTADEQKKFNNEGFNFIYWGDIEDI
ncbi:hypothetical protein [Saccharicrinis aurantiacus]|uniref:hypothetical protein n=1 Tax=Saccharicrinis aurantiacus TaxID=1849719 RepID=UPI00095013C7|nr:hypothetical protein [Saccharicrinis aurantiacus]